MRAEAGQITWDVKSKLIHDGYKVEEGGRYNEVDTYISWEHLKE